MSAAPTAPTLTAEEARRYRRALRRGLERFYREHPSASLTSLMLLLIAPFHGRGEAARKIGVCRRSVEMHIPFLREAGYLHVTGMAKRQGSGRPCGIYELTPAGEALFLP
jgi:predicted ArsR family transcriptional regulator